MNQMQDVVKTYYGETLTSSSDLKTDACTTDARPPAHVSAALAAVHDEVAARYYGCGLAIPAALDGLNVLDLGSGAGRDVFALAKLVGPDGHVTGVDMTDEQLDIARAHEAWHAEKFGYAAPNTRFVKGELEKLGELDLAPNSFDLIISNCVINLCTDKPEVFRQAHRLLKPGGELYFSDVYADRRIPQALVNDPILYGECLSGALYWGDYQAIARAADFPVDRRAHGPFGPADNGCRLGRRGRAAAGIGPFAGRCGEDPAGRIVRGLARTHVEILGPAAPEGFLELARFLAQAAEGEQFLANHHP